jgi:UDP-glucose 4-epimerase
LRGRALEADFVSKNFTDEVKQEFKDADIVINLAAAVPKTSDIGSIEASVNLAIAENLVSLCAEKAFFINCSTAEVYGPQTKDLIDECSICKPVSNYSKSKLDVENFLDDRSKKNSDFNYSNLRITNVIGPGESIKRSTYLFIESALKGDKIILHGDGTQKRNFLYIHDVVNVIIQLIRLHINGLKIPII